MSYELYLFILNSASILILVFLMVIIYGSRVEKGAKPFLGALLCLLLWATATSFELISTTFEHALFWRNVTQVGMAFMPVFSLVFAMAYINYKGKLMWGVVIASSLSNLIVLPLTFTNNIHHLIRKSVTYTLDNGYYSITVEPTWLGNAHVSLRFILIFLVITFLFRFQIKIFKSMKTQVLTLGVGMSVTVLYLVIKYYWLSADTNLMPMSLSFIILYTFVAISLFKFQFLKVNPLVKDWIINSLDEGIVVYSKAGKIIEINPAAKIFFIERLSTEQKEKFVSLENMAQMNYLSELYNNIRDDVALALDEANSVFQKKWLVGKELKYYEFKNHQLYDHQSRYIGGVTVIRNVTHREKEKNELISRAEIDMQTGVYNSRGFIERFNQPKKEFVALFVIDVDHFKIINDEFGHPIGDKILKHIIFIIGEVVGDQAILGRLGGDEFGIMLKKSDYRRCENLAKEIVRVIRLTPYRQEDKKIEITISLGGLINIPIDQIDFDQIYPMADELLYQSKANGRNQYTVKEFIQNKF